VLKPVDIQHLLEWLNKPMVISPDNLVAFDVRALRTIEDETRGDGKLRKTFAAQVQRRQFWALRLPVTSFCSTDPVTCVIGPVFSRGSGSRGNGTLPGINPDPQGPITTNISDEAMLYSMVME
jgi:hypothetical protein